MPLNLDLQQLSGTLLAVVSILAATGTALWISLVVWAFRDMRSRSHDVLSQVLAALVVGILNIPGLLVYMILRPGETLAQKYERALEEEALLQAIENKQVCPGCGHAIRDSWRICPYCHSKLKKACSNCGESLELPWSICPYCEQPQFEKGQQSHRPTSTDPTTSNAGSAEAQSSDNGSPYQDRAG